MSSLQSICVRLLSLVVGALAAFSCQTSQSAASVESAPEPATSREETATSEKRHGGHSGEHDMAHGAHRGDHFVDPQRFVAAWNAPDRDVWQKPDEILAAMRIEPGDTVVDLGAGTGYLIPKLSAAVGPSGKVIASDIEPAMLKFLQDAAAREGWSNVETLHSAADDPKLAPGSVDAVVTLNVWHHIGGREEYAQKLHASLKPGGAFVVVDFLKADTEGFGPPLEMRLPSEQVEAELRAGGFEVTVVEETMPRHYIVRGVVAQ